METFFKLSLGRLVNRTTLFYETCNLIRLCTCKTSINGYDNFCSDEFSNALNPLKIDTAWEDCSIFIAEVFSERVGQASVSNDTGLILP